MKRKTPLLYVSFNHNNFWLSKPFNTCTDLRVYWNNSPAHSHKHTLTSSEGKWTRWVKVMLKWTDVKWHAGRGQNRKHSGLFRRGLRVERVGIRSRAALVAGTMVKFREGGKNKRKRKRGEKNCKNQKLQIKTTKAQTNSGEQRFVTKWGAYPAYLTSNFSY